MFIVNTVILNEILEYFNENEATFEQMLLAFNLSKNEGIEYVSTLAEYEYLLDAEKGTNIIRLTKIGKDYLN